MGKRKKELHYGARSGDGRIIRTSIPDRTSKAARPWNDPQVVNASSSYGVPFASYKQVHSYENTLESQGSLEPHERFTCGPCGKLKASCACSGPNNG